MVIELPSGEQLNLPEAFAVDSGSMGIDLPGEIMPGTAGRRTYSHYRRAEPRTLSISGKILGTTDGRWIADLPYMSEANLNTMVQYWRQMLIDKGLLKIWRDTAYTEYINAYCTKIETNYERGHYLGRTATITLTFQADDPFWYQTRVVTEKYYCGPSYRAYMYKMADPATTNYKSKLELFGTWLLNAGNNIYTGVSGDVLKFTFYGIGFCIHGYKYSTARLIDIYVDGSLIEDDYSYSNATPDYYYIYSKVDLSSGEHVLEIHSATVSGNITFDYIDVIGTDLFIVNNTGKTRSDLFVEIEPVDRKWFMDFSGKVQASTTLNKSMAYEEAAAANPANDAGGWSELAAQSEYDNMMIWEDTCDSFTDGTNTFYAYQMFVFDATGINAAAANIQDYMTELTLRWYGYGYGPNGTAKDWTAKLYIWDEDGSAWEEMTSAAVPVGALFARSTTANLQARGDNTGVGAGALSTVVNQPRFEWGKFHNLLTANQSNVETDTTGFTQAGSTVTKVTTNGDGAAYAGTGFLKVVTDNAAANEGVQVDSTLVPYSNVTYTGSVYLRGSGTVVVKIYEYNSAAGVIGNTASSQITLTGTWTKYEVSRVFAKNGHKAVVTVYTDTQQDITFYCDNFQLEQNTSAHEWMTGQLGKAILIEDDQQNRCTNPEDLTNATGGWTETNCNTADAGGNFCGYNFTQITLTAANGGVDRTVALQTGYNSVSVILQNTDDTVTDIVLYASDGGAATHIDVQVTWATRVVIAVTGTILEERWLAKDTVLVKVKSANTCVAAETNHIKLNGTTDTKIFLATAVMVVQNTYVGTYYDGTRQYDALTIPAQGIFSTGAGVFPKHSDGYTIEMWIYNSHEMEAQDLDNNRIFDIRNASGSSRIMCYHSVGATTYTVLVEDGSGTTYSNTFADSEVTDDAWSHWGIVVDYANASARVYINGVEKVEKTAITWPTLFDYRVGIGCGSRALSGQIRVKIDSIKISDEVKTAAQLLAEVARKAQFARDSHTLYLNQFESSLAYVCPIEYIKTADLDHYVDANRKIYVMVRATRASDGATNSEIYTDYVNIEMDRSYAKLGTNTIRNKNQLLLEPSVETVSNWNSTSGKLRRGDAKDGNYFLRSLASTSFYQEFSIIPGLQYRWGMFGRFYDATSGVVVRGRFIVYFYDVAGVSLGYRYNFNDTSGLDWTWLSGDNWNDGSETSDDIPDQAVTARVYGYTSTAGGIIDLDCFTYVEGNVEVEGWIETEQFIVTFSTDIELGNGEFIWIDPDVNTVYEDDGTNHTGLVNTAFLVNGLKMFPGDNYIEMVDGGDDYMVVRFRHDPRSY